jgi:hypothetical protein
VIETFVDPERADPFEDLVDLSSGSALNPLKDLAQLVAAAGPEDGVRVIRHYDGSVQFDAFSVAGLNDGHHESARLGRKHDLRTTAKGYEVRSSRYFEVW